MYINWTTDLFESLWKEGWVNKSWPNANKPTLEREIIFVSQIKVCVGWGTWLSEMWPSQLTSSSDCVFVCFWVFFKLKKHICKCWDGIAVSEMWMPGFESLVWQKLTSFLNTRTKWESSNKWEESLGKLNNGGEFSLCKLSLGLNEFDHFLSASTWPGLGAFQTNTVCISRIQNF